MSVLDGKWKIFFKCVKLKFPLIVAFSELLCYDEDAVPLCPPKADYDDLFYCCIKNGIASCCTEEEKLGEIVGIR